MITQAPLQAQPRHWAGVDVSKRTFHAALARDGQRWGVTELCRLPRKEFVRSPEGVAAFVKWIAMLLEVPVGHLDTRVVMETTGKYSTELAAWMNACKCGLAPAIVHARQTNAFIKSMNVRGKTDSLEARALAFYGAERSPTAYEALPEAQRQLRELVRHRAQLVELKLALENRKGEGSENPIVRRSQQKVHRSLEREIKLIEEEMRAQVNQAAPVRQDVQLLCSIYGVAQQTASVILAELGDLRRFDRARQLTAYAGLSPSQIQSGSSLNKPAHLCKQGNSRVRKALYMAALTAIQDRGPMQAIYMHACANGKPKMVALGAVMRRLLVLMRAMLISGKPYDRLWKTKAKLPKSNDLP